MTDLFNNTPKKELIKQFILSRNWTFTHEVCRWGVDHFYNRALRSAQELCAEGFYRRMTEEEKARHLSPTREDVWVKNDFR